MSLHETGNLFKKTMEEVKLEINDMNTQDHWPVVFIAHLVGRVTE